MEWGRACYSSKWHLFRDRKELATKGRYYFAGDTTPFYPNPHNLGSRRWHDQNHPYTQTLGESLSESQRFDRGDAPALRPVPRLQGSSDCIATGELYANSIAGEDVYDGLPVGCFDFPSASKISFADVASVSACSLQKFYARMLMALYASDSDLIEDAFLLWLGESAAATIDFPSETMPQNAIITHPNFDIVIVAGTRNFQQAAIQATQLIRAPDNFGNFSTAALWHDASTYVIERMHAAGVGTEKPIICVGHSYGAATATLIAMRLKHQTPAREISLLGFGCPKIGDGRARELSGQVKSLQLQNDNDLVCILPPDRTTLLPIQLLIPALMLVNYPNWERPKGIQSQKSNGDLRDTPPDPIDTETLLEILGKVVRQEAINPVSGHPVSEYLARIEKRCPDPEFPIPASVAKKTAFHQLGGGLVLAGALPFPRQGAIVGALRLAHKTPGTFDAKKTGSIVLAGGAAATPGAGVKGGLILAGGATPTSSSSNGGSVVLSGGLPASVPAPAQGGLVFGGGLAAPQEPTATGGLLLGGGAPAPSVKLPQGAIRLGGGAIPTSSQPADGGLVLGGGVPATLPAPAKGGLALGGGAPAQEKNKPVGGARLGIGLLPDDPRAPRRRLVFGGGIPHIPPGGAKGGLVLGGNGVPREVKIPSGRLILGGGGWELPASKGAIILKGATDGNGFFAPGSTCDTAQNCEANKKYHFTAPIGFGELQWIVYTGLAQRVMVTVTYDLALMQLVYRHAAGCNEIAINEFAGGTFFIDVPEGHNLYFVSQKDHGPAAEWTIIVRT